MAPHIGTHQAAFGSTAIDRMQTITQAPMGALDKLKRVFSANSQLFVPNAHGNFIATGVSRSDLRKLQRVDTSQSGSLKFANVDAAKKILTASGLRQAHVDAMKPERAVRLANYLSSNPAISQEVIEMENSVALGRLDAKAVDHIVEIQKKSPELTQKLVQMARNEAAGVANYPRGITAFVARIAERDPRVGDLRGYPRPSELPDPTTLPFTPKMHAQLPPTEYNQLKAALQNHQATHHTLTDIHFDDAHHRIDFGYGIEELDALQRGPQGKPPPTGVTLFSKAMEKSPDYKLGDDRWPTEGYLGDNYSALSAFGNPDYLSQRQDQRMNAIADVFRNYSNFDHASYDTEITPKLNAQLRTFSGANTNAQFLTHVLQTLDMPGLAISEKHPEGEGKEFLIANMGRLAASGVKVIGLEHLNIEGMQQEVDAFLNSPPGTAMSAKLEGMLRGIVDRKAADQNRVDSFVDLITQAKAHGMQVVAINAQNLQPPQFQNVPNLDALPLRDATMNAVGQNALDARMATVRQTDPNAKFVLLAGGAHNKSHEGLLEKGIPGFSQIYNLPTVHIDPKVHPTDANFPITVIDDDPTQRKPVAPGAPGAMGAQELLGELSGKTGNIYGTLSSDLKAALDERLFAADSVERQQIQGVLHFGFNERGNTTAASRLQIRTALTQALAKGVSIAEAQALRAFLETASANKLQQLVTNLNGAEPLVGGALSRTFLDPKAADARDAFQNLRPLLTMGERVASEANQGVYADQNIALRRDANGDLQITNVDVGFTKIDVPTENQNLSTTTVDNIKDAFRNIASTPYSHQAVMLDFVEHFRAQKAITPGITMKQAMDSFVPDGAASMAKYGRGDCICQAEALVARLAAMNPPIKAYISGVHIPGHSQQKQLLDYQPQGVNAKTSMVTHTEVLVPYTDANGQEKVLGFSTGGGPQDKWITNNDLTTAGLTTGVSERLDSQLNPDGTPKDPTRALVTPREMRLRVNPDTVGLDAREIQKAQFGFRSVVSLVNTAPTIFDPANKQHFAINMLEGTITLSTSYALNLQRRNVAFANATPGAHGQLNFNYRDALAHPNDPVTVTLPQKPSGTRTVQMTKAQSLALFLRVVQKTSGQDNNFARNVAMLLGNERSYSRDILFEDVGKIGQTVMSPRTDALANKPLNTDPRFARWDQLMNDARTDALAGRMEEAAAKYRLAAGL